MAAPAGYTTLQVRKETLTELGWIVQQLGVPYGKSHVAEDLVRWAMTPEGLTAFRTWKASELLRGGPLLAAPKS
jgi:hypothetical protein